MTTKAFSKKEALQFGWNTMKSNVGFFIGLLLIVWAISVVPGIINTFVKSVAVALVVAILFRLIQWFLEIGLIRISLAFCDGKTSAIPDLFSGKDVYWKYVGGTILYGLIVFGGILLLIVPGIIWSIQFFFYSYLIIEKGMDPIQALKASSAMTKGHKWELFLFGLVTLGVNLLGALCLLVGLFATVPTTLVALASIYRKLSSKASA
jgi:uncharacterized membrane protein